MKQLSLQQAAEMAEGLLYAGNSTRTVESVHFDSRHLGKNSLFIPIIGNRDGHQFISQAAKQGAVAALISDETQIPADLPPEFGLILVNDTLRAFQKLAAAYRRPINIPFIAVTGSNGKTTTKDMIAHLLQHKFSLYQSYQNFNNHLGVPYSLLQLEPEHQLAVLEVGMNHAGEIDLLASMIKPHISVITTIGEAHLEHFGTKEKIALAKAELLPHTEQDGVVLLNGDSPYLRQIQHLYKGKIQYFSVTGPADIWAEQIIPTDQGTQFTVRFADGAHFTALLPLFGSHNVTNVLPAIAIARQFGMNLEEITTALETLKISDMRFQIIHSPSGAILINDAYNSSPISLKASIETFAGIYPDRKKIAVIGDSYELGETAVEFHTEVGEFFNQYRDSLELVVTIGDLSRQIHHAYAGSKQHFADKQQAEPFLRRYLRNEYVILFKASRGMQFETLVEALQN